MKMRNKIMMITKRTRNSRGHGAGGDGKAAACYVTEKRNDKLLVHSSFCLFKVHLSVFRL